MPTYTNNHHKSITVLDERGVAKQLEPGESIETWFFSDDTNLTKDSDTPLFPRMAGGESVTAIAGGVEVPISPRCDYITVEQITGTISVYADAETNEQLLLLDKTGEDAVKVIDAFGTIGKLIVKGSGDCVVYQHRNTPTR